MSTVDPHAKAVWRRFFSVRLRHARGFVKMSALAVIMAVGGFIHAQDDPAANPPSSAARAEEARSTGTPSTRPAARDDPRDQAALEREFTEMLTGARLSGSWQMTGREGLAGQAPLGAPRSDTYTVSGVRKIGGDRWIVSARIQYADKDVTIPVPVRVVWGGDVPIITLDTINLPGLGSYSARVMIHRGFYAGTWFGSDYGGVMSGQIVRDAATSKPSAGG